MDNKKTTNKCVDHKVEFQGGDTNQSDFGCDNCDDGFEIEPEACGTGA